VTVDGAVTGAVATGLLALVGVAPTDGPAQVATMARKIAELRILAGERSVQDLADAGEPVGVLLVSQFTLYADVRKGRRPSWHGAAPGSVAEPVVAAVGEALRARGVRVEEGVFGALMSVELVNEGPVTVIVDV
jgi:D-tyrosyl-tRNA(Tyr) deacylase